jgi:tetratricopeptide (TPR) repeat protein
LVEDEERRIRNFETPSVPAEITGEELEKKFAYQIASLTPSNAKSVARHLIALERFLEIDPERAYLHGKEIVFRAGRLGLVRERAGVAALRAGHFKEALKDLRAASRIAGSIELEPFIAQCEAALGNARKALEIAGNVEESKLSKAGRVEMRIAASIARDALGQFDAAALTLKCKELNETDPVWSKRLRRAYYGALIKAGRIQEAEDFRARFPQAFDEGENTQNPY